MHPRHRHPLLMLPVLAALTLLTAWTGFVRSAQAAQAEAPVRVAVDMGAAGVPIHRELLGQFIANPRTSVFEEGSRWAATADVATYLRGLYGAFYADFYDWKDPLGLNDPVRLAEDVHPNETLDQVGTLDYLRLARDHGAMASLNVNTRGLRSAFVQPLVPDLRWVMTDTFRLAILAADWVHYVNYTLQHFDTENPPDPASTYFLEGHSARLLADIRWENRDGSSVRPELPEPGEKIPPVVYWEIGNEPNYPLTGFILPPEEFARRYLAISTAMIKRDVLINGERTIKVGPSLTATYPPNDLSIRDYVDALLEAGAVIDFVSYHPYTRMFGRWNTGAQQVSGGETPSDAGDFSAAQIGEVSLLISALTDFHAQLFYSTTLALPPGTEVLATEWNPSSWQSAYSDVWKAKSMAQALGILETVFTFAQVEMRAATFFADPAFARNDQAQPMYETFKFLKRALGDELLAVDAGGVPSGSTQRAYVTRHGAGGAMPGATVLWALNWSGAPVKFEFELSGLTTPVFVGQRCGISTPSLLHGAAGGEGALPLERPAVVACVDSPFQVSGQDSALTVSVEAPAYGWVAVVIWPQGGAPRAGLPGLFPGAWRPELLTVGIAGV